jgi:hypothetical protein
MGRRIIETTIQIRRGETVATASSKTGARGRWRRGSPLLVNWKFKHCKALGIHKGFRIWDH